MALRRWIKRLERAARGGDHSFVLKDGSVFRYDHNLAGLEMMVYMWDPEPDTEPPEIVTKVLQAKDPRAVLESFKEPGGDPSKEVFEPLDLLVLLEES
jgi:hypothetical protein